MTVAQRSVLLIGPRPELLAKARALGLRTVAVHFPSHFTSRHAEHTDLALLGNYTDCAVLHPLAGAAAEVADIIGVLSNVEPGLEPAARCALLLGLRGNDIGATALLRDKQAMRVRLDECGFATVPWGPLTDAAALAAFGTEHGYPLIVKPVDGSASLGVNRLDGPGDIAKVLATVAQLRKDNDHRYAEFFPLRRFLVERYIHGPEFSVEAFSFDGRHLVIAVTEKLLLPSSFVEVGHALPARLAGPAEDAVVAEVTGFLDAVGIRHGATHTEVRVQDGRPHVIESHTRTGGDRIVDLVHAAYGVDLESWAIGWAADISEPIWDRPPAHAAAATLFLTPSSGQITEIRGIDTARRRPGVVQVALDLDVGAFVPPLRASWDRVGQVIATDVDTASAVGRCSAAVADIEVMTGNELR